MKLPLSIKETQDRLISKEFSAVDLVNYYLKNIIKHNPTLNCLITTTANIAIKEARKVDNIISDYGKEALKDYPLLGTTIIYKDIFLTKGIKTTAASKVLENFIPSYSASVKDRLSSAGSIILGKANCDAWAHGSSGENSDYGPTLNPWNSKFVPGGSSSGSAASVAANFSLVATGTDTCGSIRLPANYCGVYGLKPTYGSVSRYGVIAMASSLDSIGHFARTSEDIKKIFEITKGEDGFDSVVKNHKSLVTNQQKHFRIGIPKEFFSEGIDREVGDKIDEAIKIYKKSGAEFVEVSMPLTKYGISVYYIIQPAEVSSNLARFDGIRFGNKRSFFGEEAKRRIMLGTYVLSSGYYDQYYLKAMKVRSKIIKEVDNVFISNNLDALIAPVTPTKPFKLGERTLDPMKMYMTDILSATANLTGIPGLAVPFGFSKDNLPLGFQLMSPRFSEDTLFTLADIFEKASGYLPKVAY